MRGEWLDWPVKIALLLALVGLALRALRWAI